MAFLAAGIQCFDGWVLLSVVCCDILVFGHCSAGGMSSAMVEIHLCKKALVLKKGARSRKQNTYTNDAPFSSDFSILNFCFATSCALGVGI